jgi:hypothetical protein
VQGKIVNPTNATSSTSLGVSMGIGYIDNPGSADVVGYDKSGNVLATG